MPRHILRLYFFWQDEMTVYSVNLLFWPFHTSIMHICHCLDSSIPVWLYFNGSLCILARIKPYYNCLTSNDFYWIDQHYEPLSRKISLAWISLLIPDWHSWMVPSNSASPKFRKPAIAYSIVCSFPFFVLSSPEEWIRDPPRPLASAYMTISFLASLNLPGDCQNRTLFQPLSAFIFWTQPSVSIWSNSVKAIWNCCWFTVP